MSQSVVLPSHGKSGFLIVKLQRYSLLGWFLFVITGALFTGYVFIDKLTPPHSVVINESGQVVGALEYFDEWSRSDTEIIASSKHFIRSHLSLNTATIFDDRAIALNMMEKSLHDQTLLDLAESNFFTIVEDAQTVSRIEFVDGETYRNYVMRRDGKRITVMVNGNLLLGVGKPRKIPFRTVLIVEIIPRRHSSGEQTEGIVILEIQDV
jgi:hypothetical protein